MTFGFGITAKRADEKTLYSVFLSNATEGRMMRSYHDMEEDALRELMRDLGCPDDALNTELNKANASLSEVAAT